MRLKEVLSQRIEDRTREKIGATSASDRNAPDRQPSEDELARMKEFIAQGMKEGAFGFSSGLLYAPGSYAETDEVIERLGQEPHLAGKLEFMRASDLAENRVLSSVYDEQRLPSVIRLIEPKCSSFAA